MTSRKELATEDQNRAAPDFDDTRRLKCIHFRPFNSCCVSPNGFEQAMLDQRDFTGKAALHHAVADVEERHQVVQTLLAAKAQVTRRTSVSIVCEPR